MIIVYTYGAFDLLHSGHIKLLEKAKALGDYLIVGIVADNPIKQLKGKDRPIQSQEDRINVVSHLNMVDKVMLQNTYDPHENIKKLYFKDSIRIDILAKGNDWDYIPGTKAIIEMGGKLVKLPYSKGFSTSDMIKKIRGKL